MNSLLTIGIILTCGFLLSEVAHFLRLPKVTGYILAGICLNPQFFKLIPEEFAEHTDIVTNISLAFITFSVGGTLLYSRIKQLGKTIVWISLFEAESAFLAVAGGFIAVLYLIGGNSQMPRTEMFIPLSILLASLASPTDPSATLAVAHEYKAKGPVSSTIMGVAAFDDVLGIINFSIGIVVAKIIFLHHGFSINSCIVHPLLGILGGIAVGIIWGLILNPFTDLFDGESEGTLTVMIFALLCLCYGTAVLLRFDELLATMSMGCIVVNFNPDAAKIFKLLERYTEELIFAFFFTLSGMHLNFSVLSGFMSFVVFFVLFRALGKFTGTYLGALISGASTQIRRYVAPGLFPQGGIVIGLALMIKSNDAFLPFSDVIINIILGATVVHELFGPIVAKIALRKAREID